MDYREMEELVDARRMSRLQPIEHIRQLEEAEEKIKENDSKLVSLCIAALRSDEPIGGASMYLEELEGNINIVIKAEDEERPFKLIANVSVNLETETVIGIALYTVDSDPASRSEHQGYLKRYDHDDSHVDTGSTVSEKPKAWLKTLETVHAAAQDRDLNPPELVELAQSTQSILDTAN